MAKPNWIELPDGTAIPILYEDRSVIAIDKPAGWMLVPYTWDKTTRNLHLAISSSILAGDFWARSRNLKYLRHVHRLDADTSGVLLLAKSPGALHTFSRLFESRRVAKKYFAVVEGIPKEASWISSLKIGPDPKQIGRMKIDSRYGKAAETHLRILHTGAQRALVEARPVTGRTHQIRLHLAAAGHPVVGDVLYGRAAVRARQRSRLSDQESLALRAVALGYRDPFRRHPVRIAAPVDEFCRAFGFNTNEV